MKTSEINKKVNERYGKMTFPEFVETLREYEIEGGFGKIIEKGFEMYYQDFNKLPLINLRFKHRNKRKAYNEFKLHLNSFK